MFILNNKDLKNDQQLQTILPAAPAEVLSSLEISSIFNIQQLAPDNTNVFIQQWVEKVLCSTSATRTELINKLIEARRVSPFFNPIEVVKNEVAKLTVDTSKLVDMTDLEKIGHDQGWVSAIEAAIDSAAQAGGDTAEVVQAQFKTIIDTSIQARGFQLTDLGETNKFLALPVADLVKTPQYNALITSIEKLKTTSSIAGLNSFVDKTTFQNAIKLLATSEIKLPTSSIYQMIETDIAKYLQSAFSGLMVAPEVSLEWYKSIQSAKLSLATLDVIFPKTASTEGAAKVIGTKLDLSVPSLDFKWNAGSYSENGSKLELSPQLSYMGVSLFAKTLSAVSQNAEMEKFAGEVNSAISNLNKEFIDEIELASLVNGVALDKVTVDQVKDIYAKVYARNAFSIDVSQGIWGATIPQNAKYNVVMKLTPMLDGTKVTFTVTFEVREKTNPTNVIPVSKALSTTFNSKQIELRAFINGAAGVQPKAAVVFSRPLWVDELIAGANPIPDSLLHPSSQAQGVSNVQAVETRLNDPDIAHFGPTRFKITTTSEWDADKINIKLTIVDSVSGQTYTIISNTHPEITSMTLRKFNNLDVKPFYSTGAVDELLKGLHLAGGPVTSGQSIDSGILNDQNAQKLQVIVHGIHTFDEKAAALDKYGIAKDFQSLFGNNPHYVTKAEAEQMGVPLIDEDDPNDVGAILTFRRSTGQEVKVFVVLYTPDATSQQVDAAKATIQDAAHKANDDLNKLDDKLKDNQNFQQAKQAAQAEITRIVNEFNSQVATPLSTKALSQLVKNEKGAIENIYKTLIITFGGGDLAARVAEKLGIDITPEMLDMIEKYPDTLEKAVDAGFDADTIKLLLKNEEMLKVLDKIPASQLKTTFNAMKYITSNYKYAYLGTGVALGAAGLISGGAAIATARAAKKVSRVQGHKVKLRGSKVIIAVTSIISGVTLAGSVAMMIYFFINQGGF